MNAVEWVDRGFSGLASRVLADAKEGYIKTLTQKSVDLPKSAPEANGMAGLGFCYQNGCARRQFLTLRDNLTIVSVNKEFEI
jgi:hypothetical protein